MHTGYKRQISDSKMQASGLKVKVWDKDTL